MNEQRIETFQEYRKLLFSIAYNMLGTIMDAEDCVQDAFVRWSQTCTKGTPVGSPKSFLCTVVTRLCIDRLRSAQEQRETYIGPWLPEPIVATSEPGPPETAELSEALSVALLRMLEKLSPIERAVFVLRQAFDYNYGDISAIIGKGEDNCRQILHRAQEHLGADHAPNSIPKEESEKVLRQFLASLSTGDVDSLLSILAPDVVSYADSNGKARAAKNAIHGAEKNIHFFTGLLHKLPPGIRLEIGEINGRPGVVAYDMDQPYTVVVPEIAEGHILEVDIIVNPDKLRRVPRNPSTFVDGEQLSTEKRDPDKDGSL